MLCHQLVINLWPEVVVPLSRVSQGLWWRALEPRVAEHRIHLGQAVST
jgi:hypothetical protein